MVKDGRDVWMDDSKTIWAYVDSTATTDQIVRCGVYPFVLPEDSICSRAAKAHDYAYSSTMYQLFYTRKEADDKLYADLRCIGYSKLVATAMWGVARLFGRFFWENKKTR